MPSILLGSSLSAFNAGKAEAPKSTVKVPLAVSSQKHVLERPPEPKASPEPTIVNRIGRQAFALGRADTSAYQRLTLARPSGTASLAGFINSYATSAVMSATEKRPPATNGVDLSWPSRMARKSVTRGLLASPHF